MKTPSKAPKHQTTPTHLEHFSTIGFLSTHMKQAAFLDQISIIIHGSKTAPNCLRIPAGFTCFLVPSLPQALYSEAKLGIVNLPPTSRFDGTLFFWHGFGFALNDFQLIMMRMDFWRLFSEVNLARMFWVWKAREGAKFPGLSVFSVQLLSNDAQSNAHYHHHHHGNSLSPSSSSKWYYPLSPSSSSW